MQKWSKKILKQPRKADKKWKILNVNFGLTQVDMNRVKFRDEAVKKKIKFSKLNKIGKYFCYIL